MSNNNPTPPLPPQNQRANDPKPLNNGLAPVPLRRVPRLPKRLGVIRAPSPPNNIGGKRRTRRKHRKSRKTHRRRN